MVGFYSAVIPSPIGNLLVTAEDSGLVSVSKTDVTNLGSHPRTALYEKELEEYFAGERREFEFPIAYMVGTPFQLDVWNAILTIPYGETRTYREIAAQIGRPKAFRAIGTACGANPFLIVIPCHRVVASDGGLGGYRSGVQYKRALLMHERAVKPKSCRREKTHGN
jgi:O-6-methylguanine DNA methyltransferase